MYLDNNWLSFILVPDSACLSFSSLYNDCAFRRAWREDAKLSLPSEARRRGNGMACLMTLPSRFAIGALLALACTTAVAQDSKNRVSEEDNRLIRIIERWVEVNETERDYVVREVGRGNNGNAPDDYDEWYKRLG